MRYRILSKQTRRNAFCATSACIGFTVYECTGVLPSPQSTTFIFGRIPQPHQTRRRRPEEKNPMLTLNNLRQVNPTETLTTAFPSPLVDRTLHVTTPSTPRMQSNSAACCNEGTTPARMTVCGALLSWRLPRTRCQQFWTQKAAPTTKR